MVAPARRTQPGTRKPVERAQLLDTLTEDEWARTGIHSDSGAYSVETSLEIYADHAHDHADQITRALSG